MSDGKELTISTTSIFKVILIILLFVFLYLLRDVLIILLFAIVIASAVTPFANWLDKKKFPRILGVLFLYLAIFILVVFLLSLIIPFISRETSQLIQDLPRVIERVSTSLEKVQTTGSSRYIDFISEVQNLLEGFSQYLQASSGSAVSFIITIFGGIFSFFAIIVISFYLSVMRKGIEDFLKSIIPTRHEEYVLDLWRRSEIIVGRWLQGQLLLALVVGLAVYVGLSLLHVKFALLLGILAMVLELVPNVGPVLAAIPAVFIAFLQSPSLGLWVIVLYVIIQQLENHILVPIVLGKSTGLNPVAVIIALLIGFKLAGILGMILAVPVATVIVEVLEDFAKKRRAVA